MTNKGFVSINLISLALLICFMPGTIIHSFAEDISVVIIGNRNLPFDTISKKELADIFKQKKTMCDNNEKLHVVLQDGGETHKLFLWTYLRKTPIQYTLYWKKLVFTGKGSIPITFRSEKNLLKHVALTGGAIGYISNKIKPRRVKVIKIIDQDSDPNPNQNSDQSHNQDKPEIPDSEQ